MRAASFKSLYPKRPPKSLQLRTVAPRGAPDTALRHFVPYLQSMSNLALVEYEKHVPATFNRAAWRAVQVSHAGARDRTTPSR